MTEKKDFSKDYYRPSASVIIAAKAHELEDNFDFRILLFKRTPQTSFAPEHCVFPGGALDVFDESIEWMRYFKECGVSENALQQLVIVMENRPQLLTEQGTGCYDRFFKKSQIWARDISLRLTAIRETFEEVGILLCRKRETLDDIHQNVGQYREDFDRVYWQKLIHNDAKQLLNLCRELNVIPDLWCLQEWSTWRTPATATRKFETVYYFVALERLPNLLPESSEVELTMWHSPLSFLLLFKNFTIWLPFIIFYELSRLNNVTEWKYLHQFACERSRNGSTLLMPAYYRCIDGMVGLLPGDDKYPKNPNSFTKSKVIDETVLDFRRGAKNIHRIVHRDMHDLRIDVNIAPIDGHFSPKFIKTIENKL